MRGERGYNPYSQNVDKRNVCFNLSLMECFMFYKLIQPCFKIVINIYEILVFSQCLACFDDAAQQCPTKSLFLGC